MYKQPKILYITLSPALDRYVTVSKFEVGDINRTVSVDERAGGKGINGARALQQIGGQAVVIAAIGGHSGREIINSAETENIQLIPISTKQGTRQYMVIWDEETHQMTHISESWSILETEEWEKILVEADRQLRMDKFDAVVISGRMPFGIQIEKVKELMALINSLKYPIFVDSAGDTLVSMLESVPTVIKINNHEAAAYLGIEINSVEDASKACKMLLNGGSAMAIITLGVDGAVGASKDQVYYSHNEDLGPWPVGSGDSFLAAVVYNWALGKSLETIINSGVAAGTANAHKQVAGLFDIEKYQKGLAKSTLQQI